MPNPPSPTGGPSSDEGDPGVGATAGTGWSAQSAEPQAATPQGYPYQEGATPQGSVAYAETIPASEMPQATPQSVFPGDSPYPGTGRTGSIHKGS